MRVSPVLSTAIPRCAPSAWTSVAAAAVSRLAARLILATYVHVHYLLGHSLRNTPARYPYGVMVLWPYRPGLSSVIAACHTGSVDDTSRNNRQGMPAMQPPAAPGRPGRAHERPAPQAGRR